METINNKISSYQFAMLGLMMGNSLFVGFGIIIMITLSKQDAWLTMLIAAAIAIIPIIILIYLINCLPDKNIFEKNKIIFGKIGGFIVNLLLALFVLFLLVLNIWTTTYFSLTQYLTRVPYIFVSLVFILTAAYAAIKGIETIARTNEIAFFIAILLIAIVWLGLYPNFRFVQLKPIMVNGISPLIKNALIALSYAFPPLITLTIIPKNDIVNNKNYHKYLTVGFILSLIYMAITFFFIVGVITVNLAELFRYPAYFTKYKIDIAGFFQGVENFLSLHWLLNTFCLLTMSMYFINRYIKHTFKIKKKNILKYVTLLLAVIVAYVSNMIFKNSAAGVNFMKDTYPYYIAIPLFSLLIIILVAILIHKMRNKNKVVSKEEYLPVVIEE